MSNQPDENIVAGKVPSEYTNKEVSSFVVSKKTLREKRFDELLMSCREQVVQQIIGPFGLSSAMFEDKAGGNVTTVHNFEKGIVATDEDGSRYKQHQDSLNNPVDRKAYDEDLSKKRKKTFQENEGITSAYTGKELTKDGQTHLDHVVPVNAIEKSAEANLFTTKEQRVQIANAPENLVACESSINQSMQDKDKREWAEAPRKKDPGKTNAESFDIDKQKLNETVAVAEEHVSKEILHAQIKKQGKELLESGAKEAGKNALRQAMGVLMFEFVNGSYLEISRIVKQPPPETGLVDEIIISLKKVLERVQSKMDKAFDAFIAGGTQGFISNFLTFVINNFVTTAAKIVTIIREGIKGLWDAIKMLVSPPPNVSTMEIARSVTKIIAGVITSSLGMMFEESVKGFLLTIPILVPLADTIAPVLTGILTGLVTAFTIYTIDRLFDWLSSTGTEMLQAQLGKLDADAELIGKFACFIQQQYRNTYLYDQILSENTVILASLNRAEHNLVSALGYGEETLQIKERMLRDIPSKIDAFRKKMDELKASLNNYNLE